VASSNPQPSVLPRDVDVAERIFVGLGGNLGDVFMAARKAVRALNALPMTTVRAASWFYRTRAVGLDGPDFVNAVVELRSALEPEVLLDHMLRIEGTLGRVRANDALADDAQRDHADDAPRHYADDAPRHHADDAPRHYASRTIDLDLLCHGERRVRTPQLTLPHPRMHERAFVLAPLAELAPDLVLAHGGRVIDASSALPRDGVHRLVPMRSALLAAADDIGDVVEPGAHTIQPAMDFVS
jgi:2-amino-4-hydroxy-6-hydroxymethyldihydropteridine diphosphokinase